MTALLTWVDESMKYLVFLALSLIKYLLFHEKASVIFLELYRICVAARKRNVILYNYIIITLV